MMTKIKKFKKWIIALIFGGICLAASFGIPTVDIPVDTSIPREKISIEKQLVGKDSKKRAKIKSEAIAKYKISKFTKGNLEIEIVGDIKAIKKEESNGIQLYVRAWKNGKQLGFGEDGSVEIERFIIYDPIILVNDINGNVVREWVGIDGKIKRAKFREDPVEATKRDIAHTIELVGKEGADVIVGKIGSTVSTFYPDAGTGNTTIDGYVGRATDGTWSEIRGGAGNTGTDTGTWFFLARVLATAASNNWAQIFRSIETFDTSALGSSATISAATLSFYGYGKTETLASQEIAITPSTPANNNVLVHGDYANVGTTQLASNKTITSLSTSAYNDFALNASGISNIVKTGISKFGTRMESDRANSEPTWGSSDKAEFYCFGADNGTNKPKLVVTHSAAAAERRIINIQ